MHTKHAHAPEPTLFDPVLPGRPELAKPRPSSLGRLASRLQGRHSAPSASGLASEAVSLRSQLLHWAPVAIALVVFGQVALEGLRPALVESGRLASAEERMLRRYQSALDGQTELERWLRAQNDPIYLEREIKMLRSSRRAEREP